MGKSKISLSQWERLLSLPVWRLKQSGRWLTKGLSNATKHLPDKEDLIFRAFKSSALLLFMTKQSPTFRKKIISMLGSQPRSKWTTFLDRLSSCSDPNTLVIPLLRILGQELILRDEACQPFWNPAYKEISERLLLPIETDCVGSASSSLSSWSPKQEVVSKCLTIRTTSHPSKSSPKTSWPSSMSSLASRWEKDPMPVANLKTLIVKIHPTTNQKRMIDRYIDTSRYVYNKTLEFIKVKGHKPSFRPLRDLLVTENTKKGYDEYKAFDDEIEALQKLKVECTNEIAKQDLVEKIKQLNKQRRDKMKSFDSVKNKGVRQFELETPKDIRSCAVKRCCDAFKTGFTNLKEGNIRHFDMQFKKKKERDQTIEVTPKLFSITKDGDFKMTPTFFGKDCILRVHNRTKKKTKHINKIENNVDIVRRNNGYYVHLLVPSNHLGCDSRERVGSVDLGIRTLGTVHINDLSTNETSIVEYKHRSDLLKKYNQKIDMLKTRQGRVRKKQFNKLEKKKKDLVDRLHWAFANDLLSRADIIYLGDIKSHDIVTGGKNKTLNRSFNDLKFYQLKSRLMYKAGLIGKLVKLTPEPYTTKTCSRCGAINNHVGSKEIFECPCCKLVAGRDTNAAKNIKMKGLLSC